MDYLTLNAREAALWAASYFNSMNHGLSVTDASDAADREIEKFRSGMLNKKSSKAESETDKQFRTRTWPQLDHLVKVLDENLFAVGSTRKIAEAIVLAAMSAPWRRVGSQLQLPIGTVVVPEPWSIFNPL